MARAYRPDDADALWELKRGFELGLGSGTGDGSKAERYQAKLDAEYRRNYLDWVDRCMNEESRAVQVTEREGDVVGYVFVLPETMAHIWDGAVLNEIYVEPAHRGTDVADELMAAAIEVAQSQALPLDRFLLDVDQSNERAQSLYENYGFEHWGEMMARELSPESREAEEAGTHRPGEQSTRNR
ncbi:GNAT family N-acetyltransferase [Halodesulfurarchaeum sp. HSR-GB]|uniref:GNAT family N-acetyltransferase n=1 Tax=Halodesulfurarchaeum sp. HSR-GB TaxID=3074077 RepID=UPI0028652985|nr:GNAT family N-acetyltransferase [Halodesulfurarchaeum sp. HSR-GB]MDR5655688.1 GNAT family N-acetyltransferase [Halodesulfurarchaeum sp. HSR-GB]